MSKARQRTFSVCKTTNIICNKENLCLGAPEQKGPGHQCINVPIVVLQFLTTSAVQQTRTRVLGVKTQILYSSVHPLVVPHMHSPNIAYRLPMNILRTAKTTVSFIVIIKLLAARVAATAWLSAQAAS